MKKVACCLFYFFSVLSAQELKPLIIDADFVDYNGKLIKLNGKACVNHELGQVQAENILLIPENEDKKLRFASVKMHDEVKIDLQDGGQLSCTEAEIDYHTLTGQFLGGALQPYVSYIENIKGRDPNTWAKLEVKSSKMAIRLQPESAQVSSLVIHEIKAEHDVCVNFNNEFFALADHALYARKDLQSHAKKNPQSATLSLQANESGICQVSNRNGDIIDSKKITLDTSTRELQFESPKGFLFASHEEEAQCEIAFSCDSMTWKEPQDLLILRDQVIVNYKGIGTLTNPNEIRIQRQLIQGHKQVSLIDCVGQSELNYQDEKKGEKHKLTTHHRFVLDHQHQQAHLSSPRDSDNNVLEDFQVHFTDPMGEIFADEVFITYKEINKTMTPVKLLLKGHVWLLSRTSVDKEDPGKILQFAVADRIEYDIPTKEMLCLADLNKRVLFFDKNNNLQISASSVKAKRDLHTHKDSIQGIGDVRFSFIEKEYEQLKKRLGAAELNL